MFDVTTLSDLDLEILMHVYRNPSCTTADVIRDLAGTHGWKLHEKRPAQSSPQVRYAVEYLSKFGLLTKDRKWNNVRPLYISDKGHDVLVNRGLLEQSSPGQP